MFERNNSILFSCSLETEPNLIHMAKLVSVFAVIFRNIDLNFKWNLIHRNNKKK